MSNHATYFAMSPTLLDPYGSHVALARIAGIDEVGRGCLAGPVVAAAAILPPEAKIEGLDDSKAVPAKRRAGLAERIGEVAVAWGLGLVWPREIDRINILEATFKAMSRAVRTLKVRPKLLLVDGNREIPRGWLQSEAGFVPPQRIIVGGDALVPAISAASILAKVYRDDLMERMDRCYPGYGFSRHKGYGTAEHLAMLRKYGPCPIHRMTFRKVRSEEPCAVCVQGTLC